MSKISNNLHSCIDAIPVGVKLVAVSKFHPIESILEAYNEGQRIFGESRANELISKAKILPKDIQWHFIGHLQTNKVRSILPYTTLIHSVDSERLITLIDQEAKRIDQITNILLQVHVAQEDTKYGFLPDELTTLARSGTLENKKNIRICGIMGMATNTDDQERIKSDFIAIKETFDQVKTLLVKNTDFCILSMGMSDDYPLAIKHGSNMVRIGSSIFGNREY